MAYVDERVADVVAALEQRGFRYVRRDADNWLVLNGALHCNDTAHECMFSFESSFMELPHIWLLNVPASLQPVAPHIGSKGSLCYLAKGTIVLDIYDPVGQILSCLDRAEEVLTSILSGEMVDDLEDEFFAYWGGENAYCMLDLEKRTLGPQKSFIVEVKGFQLVVVTDDQDRTEKKIAAIGWGARWKTVPTFRIKTQAKPRPSSIDWPPRTVSDILNWQGVLDQRCRRKIKQRIEEAARTSASDVIILIESPLMTYGLIVQLIRPKHTGAFQKWVPTTPQLFAFPVVPLTLDRIDDTYISSRNSPERKTLVGKKIALVGCGTIGGYLADMLVKAGAGTGGGLLTLVDPETLYPQNLGRHRLGFSSLYKEKAVTLRSELLRGTPSAEIRALPVKVQDANLPDIDLVIDATGEEALGHWISQEFGGKSIPQLHLWIEGAGVAVRGLLRQSPSDTCFRCLTTHNHHRRYRSVAEELPFIRAGQGCEGVYVPFPAHVSVLSASLGAEMILDWANAIYEPALRTRLANVAYELDTPDCTPTPFKDCPACAP